MARLSSILAALLCALVPARGGAVVVEIPPVESALGSGAAAGGAGLALGGVSGIGPGSPAAVPAGGLSSSLAPPSGIALSPVPAQTPVPSLKPAAQGVAPAAAVLPVRGAAGAGGAARVRGIRHLFEKETPGKSGTGSEKAASIGGGLFDGAAARSGESTASGLRLEPKTIPVRTLADYSRDEVALRDAHLKPGQAVNMDSSDPKARSGVVVRQGGVWMIKRDSDGKLLPLSEAKSMDGFPIIREKGPDGTEVGILYRAVSLTGLDKKEIGALIGKIRTEGLESAGRSVYGDDAEAIKKRIGELQKTELAGPVEALESMWDAAIFDREKGRSVSLYMPFSSDAQFVEGWAGDFKVVVKAKIPMELVLELDDVDAIREAVRSGRADAKRAILVPDEKYESEYTWADTFMDRKYITDIYLPPSVIADEGL